MIFDNCETVNIKFKKVFITPEMAKYILENNNIGNRKLSDAYKKYASDMESGAWEQLSIASIILYDGENDVLKDGQHRLAAVAESGIGQWFYVYTDAKTEIIDRGKTRSIDDIMRLRGYDEDVANRFVVAIAKTYYDLFVKHNACADGKTIDFVLKYGDLLKKARKLTHRGCHPLTKQSTVAFATFCALYAGVDYDELNHFFEVVNTGFANGEKDSAAVVLRKMLQDEKNSRNSRRHRTKKALVTDMAIHDYISGKVRKQIYTKYNGVYIDSFCNNETRSDTNNAR